MPLHVKGKDIPHATEYKLYEKKSEDEYEYLATNEQIDFNLNDLNLGIGEHTIVVKATADGYEDSGFSNGTPYIVKKVS